MTVAELVRALSALPQDLPVLIEWESTLNAVENMIVDAGVKVRGLSPGAVVIDGEHRVQIDR